MWCCKIPLLNLSIRSLEVLNNFREMSFFVGATLYAMGVELALQAIAHGVGSYKDNNLYMLGTNKCHSNFIGPDQ